MTAPTPLIHPRTASALSLAHVRFSDPRRALQLSLATIWLLDGILQFQPFMFTKNFAAMVIYPTVGSNPGLIAGPMNSALRIIADHPVGTNTAFACIQFALGLAIAWRPTVKLGLAASVPWAIAVWWFGEGLGGVLSGSANPLTGAPGAVILYALLAVLLWPSDKPAPFHAAAHVGAQAARALWFVLWASLAYFAMQPGNNGPDAMHDTITGMVTGQPNWLTSIMNHAAGLTAGRGQTISIILALLLAVTACSVYLPYVRAQKAILVLAVVVAAVIWGVGEALGGVFTGMGTDPNSGPLLALLALAYWPIRAYANPTARDASVSTAEETP
jgi:hypothetical protein